MKNKTRNFLLVIILICILAGASFFLWRQLNNSPDVYRERTAFLLGTYIQIKIYGFPRNDFLDELVDTIGSWENLISVNKEGTELSEINRLAGKESVEISPFTHELLSQTLRYSSLTDQAFNPAVGPLVKLWKIGTPEAAVPSEIQIKKLLPYLDPDLIQLGDSSAFLGEEGASLDTGAIAKGYIADKLAELIRAEGYDQAIINLGGNALVMGNRPGGGPYSISVQDPWSERGRGVGILRASDISLVSSGVYERYFMEDGIRYHHILDPETGYPVQNGLAGVTIACKSSTQADAFSTAVFVMGLEKGMEFIESIPDTEALFITDDKEIYLSSGMKDMFVLTAEGFTIAE